MPRPQFEVAEVFRQYGNSFLERYGGVQVSWSSTVGSMDSNKQPFPIEAECTDEKVSLWDKLADEQGPIPAFGPARTDEHGRVVITDEEWMARRDAAIRALRAVGEITDEIDTDKISDELSRGLKGAR